MLNSIKPLRTAQQLASSELYRNKFKGCHLIFLNLLNVYVLNDYFEICLHSNSLICLDLYKSSETKSTEIKQNFYEGNRLGAPRFPLQLSLPFPICFWYGRRGQYDIQIQYQHRFSEAASFFQEIWQKLSKVEDRGYYWCSFRKYIHKEFSY